MYCVILFLRLCQKSKQSSYLLKSRCSATIFHIVEQCSFSDTFWQFGIADLWFYCQNSNCIREETLYYNVEKKR